MSKYIFLSFTCILLAANSLFAQLDRSIVPQPAAAPEIRLGDIQSFELANGLKVFVVENHKLPRVAFSLTVDRDALVEGASAGFVNMAGSLLMYGTKTRDKDQIDSEVDFVGASLDTWAGGMYGASLKKHTPKLLGLMSDVLLNPAFPDTELEKMRKQALSGLQASLDNPDQIAARVKNVLTYGAGHPYGENETEESLKAVNIEQCSEFYQTYFRPNISYLAIVGDVSLEEAKGWADTYFGKWKAADVPSVEYPMPSAPKKSYVAIVNRPAAVQSVINVSYPVDLKVGAEDAIAADVANTVLGGGVFRLFKNLREEHAYTYGAYSSLSPDKLVGEFTASASVRNEVTDSSLTEILYEMNRIRDEMVPEKELENAKNYMMGEFARSLENPQTIARFAINIDRYKLPADYYQKYLQRLSEVSAEDVQRVARKYIRPDNANMIIVGNAKEIADKLAKFGVVRYFDENGVEYEWESEAMALPDGLTAQNVVDNYVAAIGGKDNMMKVTDRTINMSGQVMGMDITLVVKQKTPNLMYQKLDGGVFFQKSQYDGKKGMSASSMTGTEILEGEALEELKMQAIMFKELKYAELGYTLNLEGMEKVGDKMAYVVEITAPSGKKSKEYFDTESGLKIQETSMIESPQGNMVQITSSSDYREVNGIKYPHKIKQKVGPQTVDMQVESIKVNTGLKKGEFKVK
jgi:predicted Zn-dependent peptidase